MYETSGCYARISQGLKKARDWYVQIADGASVRRTGMTIDEFGDYWERTARENREAWKSASPLERGITIAVTAALIGTLGSCVARMEIENHFDEKEPTVRERLALPP